MSARLRLAVFTNQFPARLSTFFARDLRSLHEHGVESRVFPLYPLDAALWQYVPSALDADALPRARVHHVDAREALALARPPLARAARARRDGARIALAAGRYGVRPALKSVYAVAKAWAWAHRAAERPCDHVLAYWGNYAASAAYVYHRLVDERLPFTMFVHARMDLYERPAFLAEKMLHADNVVLVCEYNREYLRRHFPDVYDRVAPKLHVHHLGLDLDEYRLRLGGREPDLLVGVGRLEPLKGFDRLLRAAAELRAAGRAVRVELVGGGEAEGALRRLATTLGIADAVRFRGWLAPAATREAIARAAVLVHPPVERDAMPTVLKEALALGTPVIASSLAGAPEILDHGWCGQLVPAGDVGEIVRAVLRVLDHPEHAAAAAERGRRHVERTFDARVNGGTLAALLRATPRRPPPDASLRARP